MKKLLLFLLMCFASFSTAKAASLEECAKQYAETRSPIKVDELKEFVSYDIKYVLDAELNWELTLDARRCISSITYRIDCNRLRAWNKQQTKSTDAKLSVVDGKWNLDYATYGKRLNLNKLRKDVAAGEVVHSLVPYTIPPSVLSSSLLPTYRRLTALSTWYVKYDNGESLQLDATYFDKDGKLDEVRFKQELDEILLSYYTMGKGAKFKKTGAKKAKWIKGGTWGCDVNNDAEYEYLLSQLEQGTPIDNREPIFTQKLTKIGKSYVEVSIAKQHLWIYKKGKLALECDVVTGLPTEERHTPTGVFFLLEHMPGKWLVGDDYRTWVNYWMRVNWDGVGLHDAYWKTLFGKDYYKTAGSHGCINLPSEMAPKVFKLTDVFTPVIIY